MGKWHISRRLLAGLLATVAATAAAKAGPSIVVDLNTGRVLEQEDAFRPWYPASLTKLMTTYVTFRAIKAGEITLESPVRISERASKEPPSKMGYKPGTVLSVDNAIKILMVKSANDVATSVAESVAGTRQAFVARMNGEALRLGMSGTRFVNPHGLHAEEQHSNAHDLAILAMALRNEFPEYSKYYSIEALDTGKTVMENTNDLIRRFNGADGMKTGYTCPSGFNLVATATRNGRTLMAVVIGELTIETRADKAADLLERGFSQPLDSAPFIGQLRPTGAEPSAPVNLRSVICTEEAWKTVAESRGPEGKPVFHSPHIKAPAGEPVTMAISLGATGPESTAPRYADVPIPTPRPDNAPESAVAEGG
ncbi:D-alanyl-D-alanine carboxypeptidase family protein [Aquamicrobium sp. LC103]|uniref:D-alanyl-D-alanine carboxypeptidase family protein n=1 Tax=Aquamicrobium sp. LC103 TaxID=1120658 RepID=UPI00063ED271|nr:D-alanyl-D-alanine carboxypeptidase family protein [Aquamicrobium sp. LC103]TKT75322.1 D-alanyl-D-alanine carboxypeptidase [Aquamicrobium sp. LC103]